MSDNKLMKDAKYVNETLLETAFKHCSHVKPMIAEGGAMLLRLCYEKCLEQVDFADSQLSYVEHILDILETRLTNFTQTLIKEGKTDNYLHGILSFLKQVFT